MVAAAILFGVVAAAVVGPRLYRYSFRYDPQRYQPLSAGPGGPTYYYVDWRRDWSDTEDLLAAAAAGPLRTPRAVADPTGAGWLFDPIGLVQGGLALHDQVLDQRAGQAPADSADRLSILLAQAEWLHAAAVWWPDSAAVWPVPWDAHRYDLEGPWISALSQGQAVSLLTRTATWNRPQDLLLARAAVRSLLSEDLPIHHRDAAGRVFFEEFPSDPPTGVLNGCLFAWLGLWDYARATGDAALRRSCLQLLDEIEPQVSTYELDDPGLSGWTRYDRMQDRPTSPTYQELHAALARAIAAETGRPFWAERAEAWEASVRSPWRRTYAFVRVAWAKLTGRLGG